MCHRNSAQLTRENDCSSAENDPGSCCFSGRAAADMGGCWGCTPNTAVLFMTSYDWGRGGNGLRYYVSRWIPAFPSPHLSPSSHLALSVAHSLKCIFTPVGQGNAFVCLPGRTCFAALLSLIRSLFHQLHHGVFRSCNTQCEVWLWFIEAKPELSTSNSVEQLLLHKVMGMDPVARRWVAQQLRCQGTQLC